MTKNDWKDLQDKWGSYFEYGLYLEVDGYTVTFRTHNNKMKLSVFIFVNHEFSGKDLNVLEGEKQHAETEPKFNDIATRFYKTTARSMRGKDLQRAERAFGKKWCKANGYYKKWFSKTPYWTSFNMFKAHLILNNKTINLIKS